MLSKIASGVLNKVSELPVAARILHVWFPQIVPNTSYVSGELAFSKHAGNSCTYAAVTLYLAIWQTNMELMGPFSLLQDRAISLSLAFLVVLQDW